MAIMGRTIGAEPGLHLVGAGRSAESSVGVIHGTADDPAVCRQRAQVDCSCRDENACHTRRVFVENREHRELPRGSLRIDTAKQSTVCHDQPPVVH
jgi:hypothetical protein